MTLQDDGFKKHSEHALKSFLALASLPLQNKSNIPIIKLGNNKIANPATTLKIRDLTAFLITSSLSATTAFPKSNIPILK